MTEADSSAAFMKPKAPLALGIIQAVIRITETSVQASSSFFCPLFWKSSLPPSLLSRLTSLHAGLFARGGCRVPPHSWLALMSGHSWGAGISQSRLQRGDWHWQPRTQRPSAARAREGTIIYYLHWCEKQLLSLRRHIVPWLLRSVRFLPQVCMFGFGLCTGDIFPPFFLFNPSNLFCPRRSYFRSQDTWKQHPTSPLCFISYLSYYSVEASLGLQRKTEPRSQLQFSLLQL